MAKSRVLHRLKERFGELIQGARLLSALVPLWCDTPRTSLLQDPASLSSPGRGLAHVQTPSSTDEHLELCGPADRLSFLLRAYGGDARVLVAGDVREQDAALAQLRPPGGDIGGRRGVCRVAAEHEQVERLVTLPEAASTDRARLQVCSGGTMPKSAMLRRKPRWIVSPAPGDPAASGESAEAIHRPQRAAEIAEEGEDVRGEPAETGAESRRPGPPGGVGKSPRSRKGSPSPPSRVTGRLLRERTTPSTSRSGPRSYQLVWSMRHFNSGKPQKCQTKSCIPGVQRCQIASPHRLNCAPGGIAEPPRVGWPRRASPGR